MYYRVNPSPRNIPSHHAFGYEDSYDFLKVIRRLAKKYGERIGECISTRHAFCLLRFDDTADGRPVTEWLPSFMLTPSAPPSPSDEEEDEYDPLAGVFGEGW